MTQLHLLLMGPQGSGKGTQAKKITEKLGIPHISTGDLFRYHMEHQTPLGKKVKSYMDGGNLVPDETVIELVEDRITQDDCKNGFLLDGFPRTTAQAKALDEITTIGNVIFLELSSDVCVQRISGRYIHQESGRIYNINTSPKPKKVDYDEQGNFVKAYDDETGEELERRDDDSPEKALKRLQDYHERTEPIKEYYHHHGKTQLLTINAGQPIDEVSNEIMSHLEVR